MKLSINSQPISLLRSAIVLLGGLLAACPAAADEPLSKEFDCYVTPAAVDQLLQLGGVTNQSSVEAVRRRHTEYLATLCELEARTVKDVAAAGHEAAVQFRKQSADPESPEVKRAAFELRKPAISLMIERRKQAESLAWAFVDDVAALVPEPEREMFKVRANEAIVLDCWRETLHANAARIGYGDFFFDVDMQRVVDDAFKRDGPLFGLTAAAGERETKAVVAIRAALRVHQSAMVARARELMRLNRMPLESVLREDSSHVQAGVKDLFAIRRKTVDDTRRIIESIAQALADAGFPETAAQWNVLAWSKATPKVFSTASWVSRMVPWAENSPEINSEQRLQIQAECALYQSEAAPLRLTAARAAVDRYLADLDGKVDSADPPYLRAVAAIWRREAMLATRIQGMVNEKAAAELAQVMDFRPLDDPRRVEFLSQRQVDWIREQGLAPPSKTHP